LDVLACDILAELTNDGEHLRLSYVPSIESTGLGSTQEISEAFRDQLQGLRNREMAAGMTLVGPHRDEMRFLINNVDTGVYGSRGQQRTAALAMKLAEVELMQQETKEYPVLLLDDVLSELDDHRQQLLLQRLVGPGGPQQAIITTTDLDVLTPSALHRFQMWKVEHGRLTPVVASTKSTSPQSPYTQEENEAAEHT
jgi:DNA replication and repair protein RecF